MIFLDVPVRLGRDEARRLAAEELAKAKYGGVPPELERFLMRLFDLIGRVLDRVFALIRPGSGGGGFSPLAVIAILLLVVAVAIVVWRVGLPRWRHRAGTETVAVDVTVTPQGYRERAAAAATDGDYRAAIGDRFRGLVRELEDRTVLEPRPARTATEVALGAGLVLPEARDPLERAAVIFNDAWYGDRTADEDRYRGLSALDDEITGIAARADLSEAPEPAGAAAGAFGSGGRR